MGLPYANNKNINVFNEFKTNILNLDPVSFIENNLTLDGDPFRLRGNGYKPFVDIYRYIGLNAVKKEGGKPVVLVKGRQVGATTMASALELYFMASGVFGNSGRKPIRVMHLFPILSLVSAYSKSKLSLLIGSAVRAPNVFDNKGLNKSIIQSMLDTSNPANDAQQYKLFKGSNELWIESTGLEGDRLRGRQICLETELPTPTGFVKLKDLKEGDKLFDENGEECSVKKLHPIDLKPESYRVIFDDGSTVDACAEHLWLTYTENNPTVKSTKEILDTLELNHSIPNCKPVQYKEKDLSSHPYVFGLWVGDGHHDCEIPNEYIQASFNQRSDLLQGLVDSDCCYNDNGSYKLIQARESLSSQIYELITSLGIKARVENNNDKYYIMFTTELSDRPEDNYRFIKSIEKIPSKGMRCITVDSPSKLFLITRSYIPTHNTIDVALYDECFPYTQLIQTDNGKYKIGELYEGFINGEELPLVETYNEESKCLEYKKITNAWDRGRQSLISVICGHLKFRCTESHRLLTDKGWKEAIKLEVGDLVVSKNKEGELDYSEVREVKKTKKSKVVYDIEVEDNHNFIITSDSNSNPTSGLVVHNCQDMTQTAIGASSKMLAQANWGPDGEGVQVYFGTPKQKGTPYHEVWKASTQQYYHLRCSKCKELFPLYRPDVNWEEIWIEKFTVKCTKCDHLQDKRIAAENGKWVATNDDPKAKFIGFHINQLYMPRFSKEKVLSEKPENNPFNSERIYQNEVLGEFFDGDGGTISVEELESKCADKNKKFRSTIAFSDEKRVYAGFDWGDKGTLAQSAGKQKGQSYSCAVILTCNGSVFDVEFATRFEKTDPAHKMAVVEELFTRYSIFQAVGDIGHAGDLTHDLQKKYGDRFMASRVTGNKMVGKHEKYIMDMFPKEIQFEKDYYLSELITLFKKGLIKFPYGSYERVKWLVQHCCSMDIKVTQDRSGEMKRKFVKGHSPNDGMMALLNAYIAYKFDITERFTIKQPKQMHYGKANKSKDKIPAVLGYMPR